MIGAASGILPWQDWARHCEAISASRSDKLENHLKVLYLLLQDLLWLRANPAAEIRNSDIRRELESVSRVIDFTWLRRAVHRTDELLDLLRRNIQRGIALDAWVVELRRC
jgi:hypothetical protein